MELKNIEERPPTIPDFYELVILVSTGVRLNSSGSPDKLTGLLIEEKG